MALPPEVQEAKQSGPARQCGSPPGGRGTVEGTFLRGHPGLSAASSEEAQVVGALVQVMRCRRPATPAGPRAVGGDTAQAGPQGAGHPAALEGLGPQQDARRQREKRERQ